MARLLEGCDVVIGQPDAAAQLGQGRAQARPIRRANRGFEDVADFGLGASAVRCCANAKRAMNLVREIPHGNCGHAGSFPGMLSMTAL
ncbi:MAG: hypothetical protein KDB47_11625 [Mycobacterium sp.]|nr:hypothetical protein [Mycobacterium sp.]